MYVTYRHKYIKFDIYKLHTGCPERFDFRTSETYWKKVLFFVIIFFQLSWCNRKKLQVPNFEIWETLLERNVPNKRLPQGNLVALAHTEPIYVSRWYTITGLENLCKYAKPPGRKTEFIHVSFRSCVYQKDQ